METRKEITEIVDRLPEEVLSELLRYLREIEEKEDRKQVLAAHLEDIIREDRGLLQRLAQ